MAKKTERDEMNGIASHRASRLYRLLTMIGGPGKSRDAIVRKLKIDVRSFYRDLEFLRDLGIEITTGEGVYQLEDTQDDALGKLPFPDPCFSVLDAMQLVNGTLAAKKKLKKKLDSVIGTVSG